MWRLTKTAAHKRRVHAVVEKNKQNPVLLNNFDLKQTPPTIMIPLSSGVFNGTSTEYIFLANSDAARVKVTEHELIHIIFH